MIGAEDRPLQLADTRPAAAAALSKLQDSVVEHGYDTLDGRNLY
jgi:hypothetical protein